MQLTDSERIEATGVSVYHYLFDLLSCDGDDVRSLPMPTMFDKQIQFRMGQANVRRWVDDILPSLTEQDVVGARDLATHREPLENAPSACSTFQAKKDGAIKVLLRH